MRELVLQEHEDDGAGGAIPELIKGLGTKTKRKSAVSSVTPSAGLFNRVPSRDRFPRRILLNAQLFPANHSSVAPLSRNTDGD